MSSFTRMTRVGTSVLLGIVLTIVLVNGLALAQQGVKEEAAGETIYLVLDTALPPDEALSAAVDGLYSLQQVGLVVGFDASPQTSGPNAAAALEVTVAAGRRASQPRLRASASSRLSQSPSSTKAGRRSNGTGSSALSRVAAAGSAAGARRSGGRAGAREQAAASAANRRSGSPERLANDSTSGL